MIPLYNFQPEKVKDLSEIEKIFRSHDPAMAEARKKGQDIIYYLIDPEKNDAPPAVDCNSYYYSLWVLKGVNENPLLTRTVNYHRDILEGLIMDEKLDGEDIESYARSMGLSPDFDPVRELFYLPVDQFVSCNSRLSGSRYRLSYQLFREGKVILNRETLAKIMREFFVIKSIRAVHDISEESALQILQDIDYIDSLKELYRVVGSRGVLDLGSVDFKIFPPCMNEYISQMRDGVNLPHMARFTMVSFLNKVGMTRDDIIALFKTAPDFNERMTTYQVDHVTGNISGTEYSPPKCSVLQSNHLCYKGDDRLCNQEWLKHPLQYYSIKKRDMIRQGGVQTSSKR
ncbi:MAG: DNA primase regulatory subunit PriL [Thermoplasmataceae archaeon]